MFPKAVGRISHSDPTRTIWIVQNGSVCPGNVVSFLSLEACKQFWSSMIKLVDICTVVLSLPHTALMQASNPGRPELGETLVSPWPGSSILQMRKWPLAPHWYQINTFLSFLFLFNEATTKENPHTPASRGLTLWCSLTCLSCRCLCICRGPSRLASPVRVAQSICC